MYALTTLELPVWKVTESFLFATVTSCSCSEPLSYSILVSAFSTISVSVIREKVTVKAAETLFLRKATARYSASVKSWVARLRTMTLALPCPPVPALPASVKYRPLTLLKAGVLVSESLYHSSASDSILAVSGVPKSCKTTACRSFTSASPAGVGSLVCSSLYRAISRTETASALDIAVLSLFPRSVNWSPMSATARICSEVMPALV